MPSFCPLPQRLKDRMIHFVKGFRADHMPVVIGPSPNFRIKLGNEVSCCGLLVFLDDLSDALQKGMNVPFRGLYQQFSVVLTEMLSKKIKTVLDVCDERFLLGEGQPAFFHGFCQNWEPQVPQNPSTFLKQIS